MHPELLVRKRIWLMTLMLTGLFLLAAARIAVLTTSEAASLTERGIRQWTKAGIVTARRGTITDRKGRTLAISATAYIVTASTHATSFTTTGSAVVMNWRIRTGEILKSGNATSGRPLFLLNQSMTPVSMTRASTVAIAAPLTPSAGNPNLPKIRQ